MPPIVQRLVRILGIALVLLGLALLPAALVPHRVLVDLGSRIGHGDDVTLVRVVRFRWGCWSVAIVLVAGGAITSTAGRARVGAFLVETLGEISNWDLKQQFRRTSSLLKSPGTAYFIVFVVVRISGVVLRFRSLFRPMLYDEAYSFLNFARRPLYEALLDYNNTNNHLLNTALMHVAYLVAGQTDWVLRLPAFVAGMLVLPASYFFARKTLGTTAALVGTALVAASPMLINYSAEARGYMLVTVCGLWTADRLALALSAGRTTDWVLSALAAVAGCYAMPIMVYPLAGCAIWGLGVAGDLRGRLRVMCWLAWVAALVAMLYVPSIVYSGLTAYNNPFVQARPMGRWLVEFPDAVGTSLSHWSSVPAWAPRSPVTLAVIVLAAIGMTGLFFDRAAEAPPPREQASEGFAVLPQARWLLLAIPAATFVCMVVQRLAPPPRVFVMLAPFWLLLAGSGAAVLLRAARRWSQASPDRVAAAVALGVIAGAALFAATHRQPYYPAEKDASRDIPGAARLLSDRLAAGQRVFVVVPYDKPLEYYLVKYGVQIPSEVLLNGTPAGGEQVWLLKPAGLSREDAMRAIPGRRLGSFEDIEIHISQLVGWEQVAQWEQLDLWTARMAESALAEGSIDGHGPPR